MKLPRKKLGKIFLILSVIFFPLCSCFYIVSLNSNTLLNNKMSFLLLFLSSLFLVLFFTSFYLLKTGTDKIKKTKLCTKVVLSVLSVLYLTAGYSVVTVLYIPNIGFKDWFITSAMTTMSHQYLATWFYSGYDINKVMANNTVLESGEDTDANLINFTEPNFNKKTYENEFEKEVLTKNEGNDLYKIIDINRDGFKGKLAVIYDPSKVKLGLSKGTGTELENSYGQYITQIASRYNAVLAINASGFYDPDWNSAGGVPHGIVISEGRLISNNFKTNNTGGLIGFNKDNKLILSRMSAQQALNNGIRDGIEYGPFLIVNGKPSFIKGNGGWGDAPRSAIGQRQDGIVLLLVIDGRQTGSIGADMDDLTQVMLDYGAINAANLDGGTSSAMELNGEIITSPRNGSFKNATRPVPNAWIVVK